jgi:hypothetical protein
MATASTLLKQMKVNLEDMLKATSIKFDSQKVEKGMKKSSYVVIH